MTLDRGPRGAREGDAPARAYLFIAYLCLAQIRFGREGSAHDVERWLEFKKRYQVYAAHDERHNSAVVLRAFIGRHMRLK